MEDSSSTKVDKLYDVVVCHDAIIQFEIAMCEAHFVKVFYAIANLAEDTVNFGTTHFAGHDDREEIKRSKLHDLIIVAMVEDDVDCFYDIGVLEGGAYTEFSGDLFLVLLFRFASAARTKLLYGINTAAILALYETNGATCPTAENLSPLSVFF